MLADRRSAVRRGRLGVHTGSIASATKLHGGAGGASLSARPRRRIARRSEAWPVAAAAVGLWSCPLPAGTRGVCASWPFEVSNAMRCSRTHRTRLDSTRLGAFGAQRPMYAAAASKPHRPCVAAAISTHSFARRRAWLLAASEHGRNVWICVHPLPAPTPFARFRRLPYVYRGPAGSPAAPPHYLPLCFDFFSPPRCFPGRPHKRAPAGICPRSSTFGPRQPKTQTPMQSQCAQGRRTPSPAAPRLLHPLLAADTISACCCAPYEPLRLARGRRPRIRRGFRFS